jgi:hypothetical protein
MTAEERWVLAYEQDGGNIRRLVGVRTPVSRTVVVGRHGDLPLGVEIADLGISRTAATISATRTGWEIDVSNRNGAVMHCWGQAPTRIEGHLHLTWPRIALRILNGAKPGVQDPKQHWVLLEADMIPIAPGGPRPSQDSTSRTFSPTPPQPLTSKQLDALNAVFGELLQWPPRLPALPRKLASVARQLSISESGVQARLIEVRDKALQFGLHRSVALTDPEYLYTLVRAGFLAPPTDQMERTERTW